MKPAKFKLISAAIVLVISVVLLVSASVAWFTVSTAPEIGGMQVSLYTDISLKVAKDYDPNAEDPLAVFEQAIRLGEEFAYYAPLKPISTADGLNWFLPAYTGDGKLDDVRKFTRDDGTDGTYEHANVMIYSKSGTDENPVYTPLKGQQYFDATNKGYFVYTDFWLMTEEKNGVRVTLSVPNDLSNLSSWERGDDGSEWAEKYGGLYGSYALANYELRDEENETGGNTQTIASIDNNAQTALRIGFLELDENGNAIPGTFTIYEPNADQRSAVEDKPKNGESDSYVIDYAITTQTEENGSVTYPNYLSGQYHVTRPVGWVNGVPALVDLPAGTVMAQTASAWNITKLQQKLIEAQTDETVKPNSNDVESFGRFIPDVDALTGDAAYVPSVGTTAAASNTIIVELAENKPKQIRMFIWLEGQDVDCWNDIASGSFVVNLEFAAQSNPAQP